MKACIIILNLCFASVFAYMGPCPKLTDAKSLDVKRFKGLWYVIAETMSYAGTSECGKVYIDELEQNKLNFTHTYSQTGHQYVKHGEWEPMWSSKRIFNFINEDNFNMHFWIVGTDYETWSLVYLCSNSRIGHLVSGFLLSKQNNDQCLSMVQKYTIKRVMTQVREWKSTAFHFHNQKGCP